LEKKKKKRRVKRAHLPGNEGEISGNGEKYESVSSHRHKLGKKGTGGTWGAKERTNSSSKWHKEIKGKAQNKIKGRKKSVIIDVWEDIQETAERQE